MQIKDALNLGLKQISDGGLMAGSTFFFMDTPPVTPNTHWLIQSLSVIVANQGDGVDLGNSGVFLCPQGTPKASILVAPISIAQLVQWLPIDITDYKEEDISTTKVTYLISGSSRDIVVPSGWFLRVALQNTGQVAWPAGSQASLSMLYSLINEECK